MKTNKDKGYEVGFRWSILTTLKHFERPNAHQGNDEMCL